MKVRFTANSRRRLQQIRSYHTKNGNASKGRKISKAIFREAKKLEDHPYLGQEEEQLQELEQGHRYLLVDKLYKVIYRIISPFIFITDIFDTRQAPDNMKG